MCEKIKQSCSEWSELFNAQKIGKQLLKKVSKRPTNFKVQLTPHNKKEVFKKC